MLKDQIIEELQRTLPADDGTPLLTAVLSDAGEPLNVAGELVRRLQFGQVDSIDALLEHDAELQKIGKICIAYCIRAAELRSIQRFGSGQTDNWPKTLRSRVPEFFEHCARGKVNILTFNYDRCLEFAFLNYLIHTLRLDRDQAHERIEQMSITHLHGALGSLAQRPFDEPVTSERLLRASEGIRLPHEPGLDHVSSFTSARHRLLHSGLVCFVGFGFHQTNLDRLDLRAGYPPGSAGEFFDHEEVGRLPAKVVRGTTYGLSSARLGEIARYLRGRGVRSELVEMSGPKNISDFVAGLHELS